MKSVDFQCENCGAKDTTLNVHHKRYRNDHKPWEYEDWELACYCGSCHKRWHDAMESLKDSIALSFSPGELHELSRIVVMLEFSPFCTTDLYSVTETVGISEMELNKDKKKVLEAIKYIGFLIDYLTKWKRKAKGACK
jgi:hypothetical protein